MLVLHAHFRPEAGPRQPAILVLWAEAMREWVPPGRRGSAKEPRAHPFAAAPSTLASVLSDLLPERWRAPLGAAPEQRLLLWLPSGEDGPAPSLPDLREEAVERDLLPRTLVQWTVDGLALDPLTSLELLGLLPGGGPSPAGLRTGDDLRFWQLAAGLALEAVAGELVLPDVDPLPGLPDSGRAVLGRGAAEPAWRSRWRAVLDGPRQAPRLARLAACMPPVCRAEAPEPAEAPPGPPLLAAFVDGLADAALRAWGRAAAPAVDAAAGAAEAWLAGLFDGDGRLALDRARSRRLVEGLAAWRDALGAAGDGPFRLALRLQAPEAGGEGFQAGMALPPEAVAPDAWRLHFLLQSRDDPSLLLGADAVWRAPDPLNAFGRVVARPRELFLGGLSYMARLSAPIRRALASQRPAEARLSTAEAYAFLREVAPVLEQAGFGLLVPPWWQSRQGRLGLRVRLRPRTIPTDASSPQGALGLDSLVDFDWSLALGDQVLDAEAFQSLVALRQPLLRIRGQWVQLDPFQVETALRFLRRGQAASLDLSQALALALGAEAELDGLPVEAVTAEGAFGDLLTGLRGGGAIAAVEVPTGLRAVLRPYQRRGLDWLAFLHANGLSGILADDMGLGKTVQTLAFLGHLRERGAWTQGPMLLVAPTSVVPNWLREAERFIPGLRRYGHQGADRLAGDALRARLGACDLCVTSYALLRRDREELLAQPWAGLVLDEAQNLKNPHARQTALVRNVETPWRLALTGTPVENRLTELWSILSLCLPGYLGSLDGFRRQIAIPVERHGDEQALRRLRRLTAPFILRRLKSDPEVAADLPAKLEMKVYCHLSAEQASLYRAVTDEALREVEAAEGMSRSGQVLRLLLRLKQVCNHPAQLLGQARATPGLAAKARHADIYIDQRFSDHAPVIVDYAVRR
jgi:non-specific serine/threonine protein kinase